MKPKNYVWSYRLESREVDKFGHNTINGYIVMSTECGATVATKLSADYETHYVTYLVCLGEVEIVNYDR